MISISGIACVYPEANSPSDLWENILSKRQSFISIPKNRINLFDYNNANYPNDSIYIKEAALIKNYIFDRKKFQISKSIFDSADLTHWLALDVASRTLEDSGFLNGEGLDKKNTGVIVGNTLTGEFSRSQLMRLRWPYVKNILKKELSKHNVDIESILLDIENAYKEPFVEPNEDSLSGGLSNTIAGRICNYFNFGGGGFTVDGACSSSLLAIHQACSLIENKTLKAVLVGGVDLSLDPFELIGFSRISAMSKDKMKVYDKNSDGFLPGEGCGFVLLLEEEYAKSLNAKKYVNIVGWGLSSDGKGGLTRPEVHGQKLAVERACEKAKIKPENITCFEGHGTGTPVGDLVELSALNELLEKSNKKHYISSIKGNIGHTKAAAGIAGLIKAALSLSNDIIPPITAHKEPNEQLINNKLSTIPSGKIWPKDRDKIYGISSFGFGGINTHIILHKKENIEKNIFSNKEFKQIISYQDQELLIFCKKSKKEIIDELKIILNKLPELSYSEMSDLCQNYLENIEYNNYRLCIVFKDNNDLNKKINKIISDIDDTTQIFYSDGVAYSEKQQSNICFLFPGQAAPVRLNSKLFDNRFYFNDYNLLKSLGENKENTKLAQPSIILSELYCYKLLSRFNIFPQKVIGHSLGELLSLYHLKTINEDQLLDMCIRRGEIMQNYSEPGNMIVIFCNYDKIKQEIELLGLDVAAYNDNEQIVVSGKSENIVQLKSNLDAKKIKSLILPINRMFHSRFMDKASKIWREYLEQSINNIQLFHNENYNSTICQNYDKKYLIDMLSDQFTNPVCFIQNIKSLKLENFIFIEVGPGSILQNILINNNAKAVSCDFGGDSLFGILFSVGMAYCYSSNQIDFSLLNNRFYRTINIEGKDTFFSNPCEMYDCVNFSNDNQEIFNKNSSNCTIDILKSCISEKTDLPESSIKDSDNFLKDLHLNSISVAQIISNCCEKLSIKLDIPLSEFSNQNIKDTAEFLENKKNTLITENLSDIEGVKSWVKSYQLQLRDEPINKNIDILPQKNINNNWKIYCDETYELQKEIKEKIQQYLSGKGYVLCLNKENDEINIPLLYNFTKNIIENNIEKIIVVQHDGCYNSYFKTISLEIPNLKILVIDIPYEIKYIEYIIKEFLNTKKYEYVVYKNKKRKKETLKPIEYKKNDINISEKDIVLVSGGAKGITYECVKELAKLTGCKLILIGRSSLKDVEKNLKNLKTIGIKYEYFECDITNLNSLKKIIEDINNNIGPITAIIHGAGINEPCSIFDLTLNKLINTLNVKVNGLKNLTYCCDMSSVKTIINFGSIIGRLGMEGEADYALANSITSNIIEKIKKTNKDVKCCSIEWSVWSDIGMGANIGSIDYLKNKGIVPISVEQGVYNFTQLLSQSDNNYCIYPTIGRLSNISSLNINTEINQNIPFYRFLEKIRVYHPGKELIVDFDISNNTDIYLDYHKFKEEKIFPAVMIMESSLQAASVFLTDKNVVFKSLKFNEPIVIDDNTTVRICCLVNDDGTVEINVRCNKTMFKVNHFECSILNNKNLSPLDLELEKNKYKNINYYEDIDSAYMYNNLFFQQNFFAKVLRYKHLQAYSSLVEIGDSKEQPNYFDRSLPKALLLGDPGTRDSCLHSIQSCIPDTIVLPYKIDSIHIINSTYNDKKYAYSEMVWENDTEYCYNLIIYDLNYNILEVWKNIVFKKLETKTYKSWNKHLYACYVCRKISNKNLQLFMSDVVKDIYYRNDGKPEHKIFNVSKAKNSNIIITSLSKNIVSCDLEIIDGYSNKILNTNYNSLVQKLLNIKNLTEEESITRVWGAMECLKKADQGLTQTLLFDTIDQDGMVVFSSPKLKIYSFVSKIENIEKSMCFTILCDA
jgi:enediyne polyketide synthase